MGLSYSTTHAAGHGPDAEGRRGIIFPFFAEDFRRLPRSADEGRSAIFRVGTTKAGGEKSSKEWEVIFAPT